MSQAAHEQPAAQTFELLEQIGTVEMDRYCTGCGYNLRQQAIRRETTTRLLMCKCPECGTFEPANTLTTATRSWFRYLVVMVWLLWFVIWLTLVGWSVFGVTGLAVVSGDLRRGWVDIENVDLNLLYENEGVVQYRNELAQEQQGHSSAGAPRYYYGSNAYELRPMRDEDPLILTLMILMSAAIGAVMTTITAVAMPHWRRWGYVCFAVGWPMISILIFHGLIWRENYNWRMVTVDLMNWHMKTAISIEVIAIVGGLVAVWLGRPVARGLIRVIIPPKRRGAFAYLWLADGKTPPKVV